MSRTLTVELDETVLAVIAAEAAQAGVSPEQAAAHYLARRFAPLPPRVVRESGDIRRFFGRVNLPGAVYMTNEEMDAELAKEAARGMDGEAK